MWRYVLWEEVETRMLQFCTLASGSSGNVTYLKTPFGQFLIDAGLNCKKIVERLQRIGVAPEEIDGIFITHNHSDHIAALDVFCKKYKTPIYANEPTASAIESAGKGKTAYDFVLFQTGCPISFDDVTVTPFPIPHDGAEPCGYSFECDGHKLTFATDIGHVTPELQMALQGCEAIVLESNHDYEMLMRSDRTIDLKRRIIGTFGHLNNEEACHLMAESCPDTLRYLVLAHLSHECNLPALALNMMRATLREIHREDVKVLVADPVECSEMLSI